MVLQLHGEVTDCAIDISDREAVFIEQHLERIVKTLSSPKNRI